MKSIIVSVLLTALPLLSVMAQNKDSVYVQRLDSLDRYRQERFDSLSRYYFKDDSLRAFHFKRAKLSLYVKLASGFIILDREKNEGLLTGSLDGGLNVEYFFKARSRWWNEYEGTTEPARTSVYLSVGWGPTMVAERTIPNFWYFNGGVNFRGFSSKVYYGGVFALNSSGEGPKYLYGITAGFQETIVPFFLTVLWSDKGFKQMLTAGFKIPLSSFDPSAGY